jgi:hypothetical protein
MASRCGIYFAFQFLCLHRFAIRIIIINLSQYGPRRWKMSGPFFVWPTYSELLGLPHNGHFLRWV